MKDKNTTEWTLFKNNYLGLFAFIIPFGVLVIIMVENNWKWIGLIFSVIIPISVIIHNRIDFNKNFRNDD